MFSSSCRYYITDRSVLLLNCKYRLANSRPETLEAWSPHDHQPVAIFQSAPLPPPPTLPASCSPFSCTGGGGREIRPHIQIQASTLRPQPPVPPPSVHISLPATPQQQGPEPPPRSLSIIGERENQTEKGSKRRRRMKGRGGVKEERWGEAKVRCHET